MWIPGVSDRIIVRRQWVLRVRRIEVTILVHVKQFRHEPFADWFLRRSVMWPVESELCSKDGSVIPEGPFIRTKSLHLRPAEGAAWSAADQASVNMSSPVPSNTRGISPVSPDSQSKIPVTPTVLRSIFASSRTPLEERSISRVAFFR